MKLAPRLRRASCQLVNQEGVLILTRSFDAVWPRHTVDVFKVRHSGCSFRVLFIRLDQKSKRSCCGEAGSRTHTLRQVLRRFCRPLSTVLFASPNSSISSPSSTG